MSYEVIVLGPESSPESCLRGLLQLVLQQNAKQISCMLDILHEKYGHPKEELAELIRDSPKMAEMLKEVFAPPPPPKEEQAQEETKTKAGRKIMIKRKPKQVQASPVKEQ